MTKIRVVAIDPGISGAFALLEDGKIIDVLDMPILTDKVSGKIRNRPNPALMAAIFNEWLRSGPYDIFIEKVASMPKDSPVGAFAFGKGAGMLEGCAAALNIPYTLVPPATWKRALGVPADKSAARARACQLFPEWAPKFSRVRDDGRSEACLLALYGFRITEGMLR